MSMDHVHPIAEDTPEGVSPKVIPLSPIQNELPAKKPMSNARRSMRRASTAVVTQIHLDKKQKTRKTFNLRRLSLDYDNAKAKADRVRREAQKIMWDENGAAILAILGYGLTFIHVEMFRQDQSTFKRISALNNASNNWSDDGVFDCEAGPCWYFYNADYQTNAIKVVASVLTVILLGVTLQKRYYALQMEREKDMVPASMPFVASFEFSNALLELLVILIHPLPYVNAVGVFTMNSGVSAVYTLDEMIIFVMFFRLCTLLPLLNRYVGLHSIKAQLAAKLNQVPIDVHFTFKKLLKDSPTLTMVVGFMIVTLWLAHALTIAERGSCGPFQPLADDNFSYDKCPFVSYPNSLWNIIITCTTVGYGDIYPSTDPGRFVAVMAAVVGTVVISLLVTVIDQNTQFEEPEYNVVRLIKKDNAALYGRNLAASRIQCSWAIRCHMKARKAHPLNLIAQVQSLRAYSRLSHVIQEWRVFSRTIKYHKHYSFMEKHAVEEIMIHRIAKETYDLISHDRSNNVERISLTPGNSKSGMQDASMQQQIKALGQRQAAVEMQMKNGFSRLETLLLKQVGGGATREQKSSFDI